MSEQDNRPERTAMQELIDWIDWFSDKFKQYPSINQIENKAENLRDTVEKEQIEKAFDFGKVTEQREYPETGPAYFNGKYEKYATDGK